MRDWLGRDHGEGDPKRRARTKAPSPAPRAAQTEQIGSGRGCSSALLVGNMLNNLKLF